MNTPKKKRRAKADLMDERGSTGTPILFRPIPDEAAAYLGHIVAAYTRLEQRMVRIFRIILGIESGEAAALAYAAIRAPQTRWEIARRVLENDHIHIKTTEDYDNLIDEFRRITSARNEYVHGDWAHDNRGGLWLVSTQGTVTDSLNPRRVPKSEFQTILNNIEALESKIISVAEKDLLALDKRWRKLSESVHGNSS